MRILFTMSSEKAVSVLFCTCPPAEAERLAGFLVENRHAACVNIVPAVTSIYRWQGKVEKEGESLLVIKCPRDDVGELTAALVKEHPYEVAAVVAVPVEEGNPPYLQWVVDSCRGDA